jgi:F0F1-type ATP synthase assembly protein I
VKSFTDEGEAGLAGPPSDESRYQGLRTAGLLLAIPALLIVSPIVGFFVGAAVDRWLKSSPIVALIGLLLGFVAGGRETYRIYRRYQAEEEERAKRR